ncbi:MAG: hypothetical protein LBB41_04335, partial [Prevotellaceae bacterium]|nr:hypothetical protein [Prevotellaceae bacterium]
RANKKDIELLFLEKITNSIAEKETKTTFSELVKYLNDYDFVAKADFVKSISKSFADNIKTAITTCENARKKSKEKAATAGETLYKNTKNDLVQLKAIFGEQDFRHSNVADKVANEFLQCSIDYFNYMQEQDSDIDYHARATKLVKLAQSIAVGNSVKGRAKDNLDTLEQMKNKEINNAISTLQMIKDAYEQACRRIDAQVEQQSLTLGWNQSINWSAVEENKRNALDWNKVNGLLRDVLSDKKIEKIKSCTNATQKQEFETLAEWVKKHSTSKSVINNALNNYYGKTTSTISNTQRPTTSFTPRTSSTTNNQHSKEKTWFPKNAWWVMGGIGGIIGAFVASFTIGAIIGTVLGWIIKKAND